MSFGTSWNARIKKKRDACMHSTSLPLCWMQRGRWFKILHNLLVKREYSMSTVMMQEQCSEWRTPPKRRRRELKLNWITCTEKGGQEKRINWIPNQNRIELHHTAHRDSSSYSVCLVVVALSCRHRGNLVNVSENWNDRKKQAKKKNVQ